MDVPWFMLSPSPVSLIQYAVFTWIMWGYFVKAAKYKKHPRLMSLLDGFFVVAFFVCVTDAFWVIFTMFKWLPLYPGDFWLLLQSLIRDVAGASLFFLMIYDHVKSGVIKISSSVVFWIVICFLMQYVWFSYAETPGSTDYVFAWRHGYEINYVIASWSLSHWIMRIPLWIAILKTRMEMYV